jgi:hypothetical protein
MAVRLPRPALRRLATVLLAAAAAGCGDVLEPPAAAPAELALGLRQSAAPAPRAALFDEVDGLFVRVTRGATVAVEGSFAISPTEDEIRRTLIVMLERDEEELGLAVELRRQGVAVYAGSGDVLLRRGRRTTAELVLDSVAPP